ncbi:MAG TPA: transcription-repair coupling factor [Spirochaetota bacterium]|nr:transcription-repair coupling factor [Spirochaetota bacterium]
MNIKEWFQNLLSETEEFKSIIESSKTKKIVRIGELFGSAISLLALSLYKKTDKSILFLCKSDEEAEEFVQDFVSFGIEKCYYFPSFQTTPYSDAVMSKDVSSQRLEVFKRLLNNDKKIVVSSVGAVFTSVTPKNNLLPFILNLKKGDLIEIEELVKRLIQAGYSRVNSVSLSGEFAVRGNIVDIFYSTFKSPVRLDFFDIEIESIRSFNPFTQKSEDALEEVVIPPHKEIVYNEAEMNIAVSKLADLEGDQELKKIIRDKILNYQKFDGEQYILNLLYEKTSLCSYFEEDILIVNDINSIKKSVSTLFYEFEENYHSSAFRKKPKLEPNKILWTLEEIYGMQNFIVECNYLNDPNNPFDYRLGFEGLPIYLGNIEQFSNDLKRFLEEGYKILIFAVNDIQKERLTTIFRQFEPKDDRNDVIQSGLSILPLSLNYGFLRRSDKILFINDYEIFGKRTKISKHFYTKRTEVIESFIDLKPGDYIAHIHHGIGQFLGVERVKSLGTEKDYISIQYAEGDKIFIPVEQLNFIQKYLSSDMSRPKLDRIGTKSWSKTKERVQRSIEELARELVQLYSERIKAKGFAFASDAPWQREFEAKFPYEETEDQLLSIEEVERDMESDKIMDRLICGDVGFGKTEVAIRAAFKAVMSGRQVIILTPTTILTEQHYENFSERLKDYPIKVETLSRFRSEQEQKVIINELKNGEIDIIIGTHRLLSNDVVFKNPGLVIVDEEHRFGVKHKEKLKKIRLTIDSISMTATPIPRTLHMSLAKIRDMSVINTPPKERMSVETYVMEFNEDFLVEAIRRELGRNGQIFFIYNRVKTIYEMKKYLQRIYPAARVVVAHGQMNEEDLEDIIRQFVHREYDILLTTTIVESGIDIPRANTIIIDRADRFGLSQLYQLRGRVGRSNVKAYAYLFYDANGAITEDAMKRLRVISEYTDLGSGFKIAMKDLEIRGAGNLFGPEQSGNILAVGFHLYCKLLSDAVKEIQKSEDYKGEKIEYDKEVYLELNYKGFISDSYISDVKQKIEFYKRIAGVVYHSDIEDIKRTMEDRFGPLPEETLTLLFIAEIRVMCKNMSITEMIEKSDKIEIVFDKFSSINLEKLMKIITKSNGNVYLLGKKPNSLFIKILDEDIPFKEKWDYIKNILTEIKE